MVKKEEFKKYTKEEFDQFCEDNFMEEWDDLFEFIKDRKVILEGLERMEGCHKDKDSFFTIRVTGIEE